MTPIFPNFVPIDRTHKNFIDYHTNDGLVYSDFSFANLFCWSVNDTTHISQLNENLVVKIQDYLDPSKFITSIHGTYKIDESIDILLKTTDKLELVPQSVILNINHPDPYAICEDRSSFDYVYNIQDIVELAGAKYKNKRNRVKSTKKLLEGRLNFSTVTVIDNNLAGEIIDLFKRWQKLTWQDNQKTRFEEIAIRRLVSNFNLLNLHITLCRLDGRLEGFSVNEIRPGSQGICHFEKCINNEYPGLGATLINEAAIYVSQYCSTINWEQDLGIEGLKIAKSSYHPINYNRKYTISTYRL
jgi:hypothetical protein